MGKKGKKGKKGKGGCGFMAGVAVLLWTVMAYAQEAAAEATSYVDKWDEIVAILLPLVIASVVKESWASLKKAWIMFGIVAVFAFIRVVIEGDFAVGDMAKTAIETLTLTVGSYLVFWKPLGIADLVEKKVNG